jgi:hypothetical protein
MTTDPMPRPQIGDIWHCRGPLNDYYALILEIQLLMDGPKYVCLRLDISEQIRLQFTNPEWYYTKEA